MARCIAETGMGMLGWRRQVSIATALWACVKPGGAMVVVEHGDREGFQFIKYLRFRMLSTYPNSCEVLAPCMHNLECPMAGEVSA